mgnify:CR=1 FL=1
MPTIWPALASGLPGVIHGHVWIGEDILPGAKFDTAQPERFFLSAQTNFSLKPLNLMSSSNRKRELSATYFLNAPALKLN